MFTQKNMINLGCYDLTMRTRMPVRSLWVCNGCKHECPLWFEEVRTIKYPFGFIHAYYPKIGNVIVRDYLDERGHVCCIKPDYDAMVARDMARKICTLCDNYIWIRRNKEK